MSEQSPQPRVTEAGYLGINGLTDDVIDTDTLYEALLNPHDGAQGKNPAAPAAGMMMPPMGMMGGHGQGGSAPAGGAMPPMAAVATGPGRAGAAITGAGGGGLAAEGGTLAASGEPEEPTEEEAFGAEPDLEAETGDGDVADGGDGGWIDASDGADLGPVDAGGAADGGLLGQDVPGLGGEPSFGGDAGVGDEAPAESMALAAPVKDAVAHSGTVITIEAKVWEGLAAAWPPVRQAVEAAGGDASKERGGAFGLVGEIEHGFNVAHVWLVERAREAGVESGTLVDALVDVRKKWDETEQDNVAQASEITLEESA